MTAPTILRRLSDSTGQSVIEFALAAPAATTAELVHVTVCPAAAHAHVVPLADTKASPVGSVSVTVIVPDVGAPPSVLSTVIV